ncbi:MAG: endonuclease/exonuclease/phosphatase family protein [Planctomycetes bacterium]|nr:endonuclease/exonuclease/phosphatase family protein [Planctomycetota bacterium]
MTSARTATALLMTLLSTCGSRPAPSLAPRPDTALTFAFWNVENLFDAEDDPANPGDDEYLPATGWTADRYARKRDHLAEVVATLAPHVIGFAEVENRRVLDDLFADARLAPLGFSVAHVESPDKRGIDVALAYRAPLALRGDDPVRLHPIDKPGEQPTRGVLEVRLEADGQPLFVLVNHWPSRGGDRDGAFRRIAGARVREVVDAIVAQEATAGREADVLIVGDLNDDPWDASVVEALGAVRSRNATLNRTNVRSLFNPTWSLLAEPDVGTLYYNPEWTWNVFDQAIVTRGMLDDRGFAYVDGSLARHASDAMRDRYGRPRWFRAGRNGEWTEGYSDHFPIHGRLALRAP